MNAAKRQLKKEEGFLYYPKYLFYLLVYGYQNNPYEMAARDYADRKERERNGGF